MLLEYIFLRIGGMMRAVLTEARLTFIYTLPGVIRGFGIQNTQK